MDSAVHNNTERWQGRSGGDRRKNDPRIFSKYWFFGRRKTIRRESDKNRQMVLDVHSIELFAIVIVAVLLTILDASFTLILISKGASEINPIMAFFLELGPSYFFIAKYLLTCFPIILILLLKNTYLFNTNFKTRSLLYFVPLPFYLVVQWQFVLMLAY